MNKKIIFLVIIVSFFTIFAFSKITFAQTGGGGGGGCGCTYWTNQGCGLNNCSVIEQYQTRNCTPENCSEISRCIYDTSCIKISEESKTVKYGEIFYVYASAKSPYKWELKNYDKEYLDSKIGSIGCSPYGDCDYSFQFNALKEGKTTIELNKIDTTNNITVEKKYVYVTITLNVTCIDSDGGLEYYTKGNVTVCSYGNQTAGCGLATDFCTGNVLIEGYCDGTQSKTKTFTCSYGCKDGACIKENEICTDSDNGKDYYVKGCLNNGVCDQCGLREINGMLTNKDYCKDESNCVLFEVFCPSTGQYGSYLSEDYKCPYGCKNGACIKETSTCTNSNDCIWCGSECVKRQDNMVCPTIMPPQGYTCTCDVGKCTKKLEQKCVNHAQCSQACDDLGITSKWMGIDTSRKSWTGTCPSNVYGCMSGDCCLGQCNLQYGSCTCLRTNVVDIYGDVCPTGQTCGQDCYCHASVPIKEEYKTVNLGEVFTISLQATSPYSWKLKTYDNNYLEYQSNIAGTCGIGPGQTNPICTYPFSFRAINSGKTTIEIDKINSNDNNVVEIIYIYVTINPSETKIAYLNQPFELKKMESAEIIDYRNLMVTLDDLILPTGCQIATTTTTGESGGVGCAYVGGIAIISIKMPNGLTALSMKISEGNTGDTPFGVKIRFDRIVDSNTGIFTVYQEINEFNFYVKTDRYTYSPGKSVRIDAVLSGSSSFNFNDAVIVTTVTDPDGRQYEVKMDSVGASSSGCTQSMTTKTYTCSKSNDYYFTGTYDIPSDASTGNYRVLSTAITSTIKKNAETNFEVEKSHSEYVDVSIKPQEQYTEIGKEVYYEITITDKHPVPTCTVSTYTTGESCINPVYNYYINVNGLPYNTKYQNNVGLPAGGSMNILLWVFPSSTGTSEGVTTATTTTGTIDPTSSEQRIVSISTATGEAITTTQEAVQLKPIKQIRFKFRVKATQQDNPRASDIDEAILFVRFIETPQPPPFPETEKIDIELRNGWNLISAPGYGYFSSGSCSDASKPVAFIYLTDQKRYVSFDEALTIMGSDKLKEYLSTHSFWVYSYENCKITFNIEKYSTYSGLQLDQGWNLLGVTKDMVGETMNNIKGSCTFEKLYSWDAESKQWVARTENDLIEKMGYGGIVKVLSTCNLNNNIIQPPTLPG